MNTSKAVLLLAAALSVSSARAACDDALKSLFGLRLEPVEGYESRLPAGVRRDGSADVIPGVGFESLQGRSGDFVVDRIMAFYDGGRFHSIQAFVDVPGEPDHGLARVVADLAATTGVATHTGEHGTVFECAGGLELTAVPMAWNSSPHVRVQLTDPVAEAASQAHVTAFCASYPNQHPCRH